LEEETLVRTHRAKERVIKYMWEGTKTERMTKRKVEGKETKQTYKKRKIKM
jgi:hypothetical protein